MLQKILKMNRDAQNAWRTRFGADISRPWNRFQAWLDMMILDHGFLRVTWKNLHEIDDGVWRSNQPSPRQIRMLAEKHGIKTIINLRGSSAWGQYHLEHATAADAGIRVIDCRLFSRKPPTVAEIEQLFATFEEAERPFLMHCKSGADRAGIASALYMLWKNRPPEEAAKQLSWTYLHMKHAKTGMLDEFIEAYVIAHAATGIGFKDWLHAEYDQRAMVRNFKASPIGNWVVDRLLMRE
ncbi:MAG: tyrosine-protein phosphatase [Pseudomonadota bacterium]